MKILKILGAGPSGLSAAINLAKASYDVEVFEKRQRVGERFNGDLQGLENWSDRENILEKLEGMNIKINFDCSPFDKLTLRNMSKEAVFIMEKPAFYLVKRGPVSGSLDQGLKEQALNSGVRIHFGKTIPEEEADIVAIGPDPSKAFGIVRGIIFLTSMEDVAVIILNDDIAFKGYSYLLVTNGYGCLCSVVIDRPEKAKDCFSRAKATLSKLIDLDVKNPHNVGGIGSFSIRNQFQKEGRLYVGEAAGLQDLLWGFGIEKALTSGYLAARSITYGESYENIAMKSFEGKLKSGLVNRFLWDILHIDDYSLILGILIKSKDVLEFLHSYHNFNPLQRMLHPVASQYLKRKYKQIAS